MTKQFTAYSQYYDLLYQDKDYQSEATYVAGLLRRFAPDCRTTLELGCGTGRHAELLVADGFRVTGVELSQSMLEEAKKRADKSDGLFEACGGDARSFRSDRRYDTVISLFHVVSYQTTNQDVSRVFATATDHLPPGGVFLFDVWYGPAVLSVLPSVRVKRMQSDRCSIVRIAEPSLDVNRNRVEVTYSIFATDANSGQVTQVTELHPMRYYFTPELELLSRDHGLEIVHSEEWVTGNAPGKDTWSVCFLVRKAN